MSIHTFARKRKRSSVPKIVKTQDVERWAYVPPASVDEMRAAMAIMLKARATIAILPFMQGDLVMAAYFKVSELFGSIDGPRGHVMRRVTALMCMPIVDINDAIIIAGADAPLRYSTFTGVAQ